jgi:hypothetical protein
MAQLLAAPHPQAQPPLPTQLSFKAPVTGLKVQATGFRPLDKALGVGGLPRGHLIELIAAGTTIATGGTTVVAAKIAAKMQRQQDTITIIDLNHSFDPWQAERCGLVAPHLFLIRPNTIFAAVTALESAARHAQLVVVVMGTVADLLQHLDPTALKTLLRRIQHIVKASDSVFLCITTPQKNDPFNPANYPPAFPLTEATPIRLWLQEENWSYKNGLSIAYKATVTVIKNDLALAGKSAAVRVKFSAP